VLDIAHKVVFALLELAMNNGRWILLSSQAFERSMSVASLFDTHICSIIAWDADYPFAARHWLTQRCEIHSNSLVDRQILLVDQSPKATVSP
jgi:hypothetical protein